MDTDRVAHLRTAMARQGVDIVLVTPSADMQYFTGFPGRVSERPMILALSREGTALFLVADLEVPGVPKSDGIRVLSYGETQNPIHRLYETLQPAQGATVAISDWAPAGVLLRLQAAFAGCRFVPASALIHELRVVKSEQELACLREAAGLADAAFADLVQLGFAGRTERELARQLKALLRDQGLDVSGKLPIVASGPHAASPHHHTGDRKIREGDAIVIDFVGTVEEYYADITRTVHVGTPDDGFQHVYSVVQQAQEIGVRVVAPGVEAQSVDAATRDAIVAAGYGDFFIHRTGHGIGLEVHEDPYIVAGNTLALKPGMTFSVEPGVYLPGRFGVRIEDIVTVTPEGGERLNHASRDLIAVR